MKNSQTSSYEPPPLWNCRHNWMMLGSPIRMWVGTGSGDDISPEDSPVVQKRKCLICGGVEWANLHIEKEGDNEENIDVE